MLRRQVDIASPHKINNSSPFNFPGMVSLRSVHQVLLARLQNLRLHSTHYVSSINKRNILSTVVHIGLKLLATSMNHLLLHHLIFLGILLVARIILVQHFLLMHHLMKLKLHRRFNHHFVVNQPAERIKPSSSCHLNWIYPILPLISNNNLLQFILIRSRNKSKMMKGGG